MGSPETSGGDIPILKCRGSHYQVGFLTGERFKDMIQDLLKDWKHFKSIVKTGMTPPGQKLVQNCLKLCREKFPGYVDEIRGTADGAEIEFEKLFMLNIDSILSTLQPPAADKVNWANTAATGCTSILCNKDEVILGHTEDALVEINHHIYIVSAEILDDSGSRILEKFTTLCYAGSLMGYTMGFNDQGMIYSVNTIFPNVCATGTPRSFIARALLGAPDLLSVVNILKDEGNGISDGISVNLYFYPKNINMTGSGSGKTDVSFYNIETAPPKNNMHASIVDVFEVKRGTCFAHCNKYLRIKGIECNRMAIKYSDRRNTAICNHNEPARGEQVREILSDQTDHNYPLFNTGWKPGEKYDASFLRTVAAGVFDIQKKTWSVYTSAPATGTPVHVFDLN